MKKIMFMAALSAAFLVGLSSVSLRNLTAHADGQEAGVFARWLDPSAPECVPVSEIGSASRLIKLTPAQFQFARGLYAAIPPISQKLPPGESAIVAIAGDKAMVALVSHGETCARFLAPDFILSMLVQVGEDENRSVGDSI